MLAGCDECKGLLRGQVWTALIQVIQVHISHTSTHLNELLLLAMAGDVVVELVGHVLVKFKTLLAYVLTE